MNNPYAWNTVNPDMCYGRDALLSALLSGLPGSPRHSFRLVGGEQMGKTTLLRRVQRDLRSVAEHWRAGGLLVIPLYIDICSLPRPLTASSVWGYVLDELQNALLVQHREGSNPLDFGAFKQIAQPLLLGLAERPRVIALFDEIELLATCDWAQSYFDHWRALLSNTPGLSEFFTAVFAGDRELTALKKDVGSPIVNILEWLSLQSLDYEDACQLMQEPIGIEWPETFLRHAYAETGGHPMLLQYIMQHVCVAPSELAEQSLEQAVARFAREQSWQFRQWWRRSSPISQRVYARLPDDGTWLSLHTLTREFGIEEANDALDTLQHLGLITVDEDELALRYSGEMFRRWYRIYGTLTETAMHDPELHARLAKVGNDLADKYLSAWKIYQADLPNYSGAVGEMRDTLTLLLEIISPEEQVSAEPGFKLEAGERKPTRRQRVRYAARQRYNVERTKEIVSDYDLLETECEQLAQMVARAYQSASGMTHTTVTRERAYRTLKQWDSILAQLLAEA